MRVVQPSEDDDDEWELSESGAATPSENESGSETAFDAVLLDVGAGAPPPPAAAGAANTGGAAARARREEAERQAYLQHQLAVQQQ